MNLPNFVKRISQKVGTFFLALLLGIGISYGTTLIPLRGIPTLSIFSTPFGLDESAYYISEDPRGLPFISTFHFDESGLSRAPQDENLVRDVSLVLGFLLNTVFWMVLIMAFDVLSARRHSSRSETKKEV